MNQTIAGFYQASTSPAAKMTHIVGDGRPLVSEKVLLNGQLIATNPFVGADGPKWDNPTFDGLPVPAGAASADVRRCPQRSALRLSVLQRHRLQHGRPGFGRRRPPRRLGVATHHARPDPNGQPLPNLEAMGADPYHKDLFVEIGYMETYAPTTLWRRVQAGALASAHARGPEAGGRRLRERALRHRIRLHFDVGALRLPGGRADSVHHPRRRPGPRRRSHRRDRSRRPCTRCPTDPPWVCQFSEYPGTVGWKSGFRFLRDEVFSVTPTPPVPTPAHADSKTTVTCPATPATSDSIATGRTCSGMRCSPTRWACRSPKSVSRRTGRRCRRRRPAAATRPSRQPRLPRAADEHRRRRLPGRRRHGDARGVQRPRRDCPWARRSCRPRRSCTSSGTTWSGGTAASAFEPNCKPTYLSVMNYLYQLRGLLDDGGKPHLDFSRDDVGTRSDEASWSDGPWGGSSDTGSAGMRRWWAATSTARARLR